MAFREGLLSFRTPKKFSPGKTIKVRLALYSAGQLETPTVTVALAEVEAMEEGGYLCTGFVKERDKKLAILTLILARGGIAGADRRRTKRLTASIRILSRKLANFRAVTANLNETGVELISDGSVANGTYLNLQFDLESTGSELTVQAVVIWSAQNPETEKFRVGVAFTEQHPETHATWSEFYKQLLSTEGASVMLKTMGGGGVPAASGAGTNEDLPPLPPPPQRQAPPAPAASQPQAPPASSSGFTPPPPPSGYQSGPPNKQFDIPSASPANPLGGGFHSQAITGPGPSRERLQLGGGQPSAETQQNRGLQLPGQNNAAGFPGTQRTPGGFPQPPGGSSFQIPGAGSAPQGGGFSPPGGGFQVPSAPQGGGGFTPPGGGFQVPSAPQGGGFTPPGGGFQVPSAPQGGGGFTPPGGGFQVPSAPQGGGGFTPPGGGFQVPSAPQGGGFTPPGGGFQVPSAPQGGGGFTPPGGGFQVPVPPTSTPGTFQPPAPTPPPAPAAPEQVQPTAMSGQHIQFRTRQQQRYQMGGKTQVKLVLNVNGNATAVVVNIQVAKMEMLQDQSFAVWGLLLEEERKVAALRAHIRQV